MAKLKMLLITQSYPNGRLRKNWADVKRNALSIAARSLDASMSSVVMGDVYRIYLATQRDGIDHHPAYIPDGFPEESTESFDREYMTKR